jgi:hypothetical protein
MDTNTIIGSLLTLSGTPGQILTRIIYLNNSNDKLWLLLFPYFPYSLLPTVFYICGMIQPGTDTNPIYDTNAIIGMICIFLLALIIYKICSKPDYSHIHKYIGIIVHLLIICIIAYVYYNRFSTNCKNINNSGYLSIMHSLVIAPVCLILSRYAINVITNFYNNHGYQYNIDNIFHGDVLNNILGENSYYDNIDLINFFLLYSIFFIIIYIVINIFYSDQLLFNTVCNSTYYNTLLIILILVTNITLAVIVKPKIVEGISTAIDNSNNDNINAIPENEE